MLGGELEKLRIQKLLFLYSQRKKQSEYDFIPYKFGCYSYSANADLTTMVKKEQLIESENCFIKNDERDFVKTLKAEDKKHLEEVVALYGNMSNSALIKHTYINFPYYAIRSTIAHKILDKKYLDKINKKIPTTNEVALFTIGYEGLSLEKYLNKLVQNDVRLLVDVRKNPLSMKFGFSKTLLKKYCQSLNIDKLFSPF